MLARVVDAPLWKGDVFQWSRYRCIKKPSRTSNDAPLSSDGAVVGCTSRSQSGIPGVDYGEWCATVLRVRLSKVV